MNPRERLREIEQELNSYFLERNDVVRGLLVGLLARQNVLFIGKPGTAKTQLGANLCERIEGARYFPWLLTRFSTPEELFGPISLKALEEDSYRRVTTGKLPEATIALLDEIWKANSAILNSLLSIINERVFYNDGKPQQVPLQLVIGASNELPEDRQELGAMWDRFLLRYIVNYVREDRNFEILLAGERHAPSNIRITLDELNDAQNGVIQVSVSRILPILVELRRVLAEKNIIVSDRRWKQSLDLIRAFAWLEGRNEASLDDLEILGASLWQEPEQYTQIRQEILRIANPLAMIAQDLLDEAAEQHRNAMAASGTERVKMGMEAASKLRSIIDNLNELKVEAQNRGKSDERILDVLAKAEEWNREVILTCLGVKT